MTERLKFMGRLKEKELEAEKLKLRIEGLRDSIRDILDPFESVEDLKMDVATEQIVMMGGLYDRYLDLLKDIARLKKELGE